ncbi:translocation protein SEC62-like [Lytechinus pictus]|uniref:translocation protein SEC62-like n=1 Tax=Lytechinus pictus TaxID=7653 RepID=UPI0030B9AF43
MGLICSSVLVKMAERTTRRRKKKESTELEKPTKEETAVARHIRFNLPTKNTSIDGHRVEYFTGSKAVDFLLDSKWASGKGKTEVIFTDRESVANYLDGLLWKGLFYRALKVVKKSKKEKEEGKKEKKSKKEKKKTEAETTEKGDEKEKEDTKGGGAKDSKDGGKEETPPKKKDGKKKIKLELTDDQKFADGNDAFVWVYDPVRPMNYVYGLGLVIGAIAVCLFPLWPPWMRTGTYYLCLCGAGFVGAIFALAIIRLIIFVLTWGSTFGKIHFWLFPNLLADVGIKESFMPFYEVEYMTKKEDDKTEKSKEDSNDDEKGSEAMEAEDQPNQETTQDIGHVENIPENIGDTEERYSDQAGTPPENSDITEERSVESGDADEVDDDEEDDDDDDDDNGDDFEMINEEEISEVCDGSGGSQHEEEEE